MPYPPMGYSFDKAKFELATNGEQEKKNFGKVSETRLLGNKKVNKRILRYIYFTIADILLS